MEEPEREVDYLKTIRRKTKGRMILAVVCTLLVLAALWGLRVYVIGAPADREAHPMSFGVHTHPAEETLDLRILAPADAPSDAPRTGTGRRPGKGRRCSSLPAGTASPSIPVRSTP